MRLNYGDTVVTAFAESASGPGWANHPLWLIVRDKEGNLREECIQQDEQTQQIQELYAFSHLAHTRMVAEVEYIMKRGRPK